jgi:hypothetical protein
MSDDVALSHQPQPQRSRSDSTYQIGSAERYDVRDSRGTCHHALHAVERSSGNPTPWVAYGDFRVFHRCLPVSFVDGSQDLLLMVYRSQGLSCLGWRSSYPIVGGETLESRWVQMRQLPLWVFSVDPTLTD